MRTKQPIAYMLLMSEIILKNLFDSIIFSFPNLIVDKVKQVNN